MPEKFAIGRFIRERRRQLGLTQEELAERISKDGNWLSQSDISRIETGRVRLPRPERLDRIAEALEVPLGDLLASVAAVSDDGQFVIDDNALALLYGSAGLRGSASAHGLRLEANQGDNHEMPAVEQITRAYETVKDLLDGFNRDRRPIHDSMSGEERQHAAELLDELGAAIHDCADQLRDSPAQRARSSRRPGESEDVVRANPPAATRQGGYFRHLLDSIGQSVIVTDTDGTIKFWNRSAEELFGWKADEVLGRNVLDVTPSELSREEGEAIMEQLLAGKSWSGRFRVRKRDGTSFWAFVTDTPVRDDDGNLNAIIGIAHEEAEQAEPTNGRRVPRRAPLAWATLERVVLSAKESTR